MSDLTKLTAANLLERCPERIVTGNWKPEWAEIRRRLIKLEELEHAQGCVADKEKA